MDFAVVRYRSLLPQSPLSLPPDRLKLQISDHTYRKQIDRVLRRAPPSPNDSLSCEEVPYLTALGETAEMTRHASFLEADGLSALGASFSKKTVLVFVSSGRFLLAVPRLQDTADRIRNRENKTIL